MSTLLSSILLLCVNLGLLWLLMAAPVGTRTIRLRRTFRTSTGVLWRAIDPAGERADWHPSVLTSRPLDNRPTVVEQTYRQVDRRGLPVRRLLAVEPLALPDPRGHAYDARIIDDSTLDGRFWRNFHERRKILEAPEGATLIVEQTDNYRGLAFFLFRYFALHREMRALEGWLATGEARKGGMFEHPATQTALAVLSTLLLWPFFGFNAAGLMISTFLTMVIALHELGHMAAYRMFGHTSVRMIFIPLLGGVAIGGRPYNSQFEVATCAMMGPGMSAFLVPILVLGNNAATTGSLSPVLSGPLLVFLLILGSFNLLNLLPMSRFDGGQVLRQLFRRRLSLLYASFAVTLAILGVGWQVGLPPLALLAALAVFTLLSLIVAGGYKPKERLDAMRPGEPALVAFGLYAAVILHGYAVIYAADILF